VTRGGGAIDRERRAALGVEVGEQPGQVDVERRPHRGARSRGGLLRGLELDGAGAPVHRDRVLGRVARERDDRVLEVEAPEVLDDGRDHLLGPGGLAEDAAHLDDVGVRRLDLPAWSSRSNRAVLLRRRAGS
jgi:hypothetical protein